MTIKKLESPNSFSFFLYVLNASSPSRTRASEDASSLKFDIPKDARTIMSNVKNRIGKGFDVVYIAKFFIKFFIVLYWHTEVSLKS